MLGILLYEAFDLVYYTGKISVNGVCGIYNWCSGTKTKTITTNSDNNNQLVMLEERIKLLEDIIKKND
jgi:hypothetical protein